MNAFGVVWGADSGYARVGAPRFTGDIDVFVKPTQANVERLLVVLKTFGFPVTELRAADLVAPTRILQMGIEPVKVHVMSHIDGVTWDEAWVGREVGRCGSYDLPFIGRREFVQNEQASGRLKDLADIDALRGGNVRRSIGGGRVLEARSSASAQGSGGPPQSWRASQTARRAAGTGELRWHPCWLRAISASSLMATSRKVSPRASMSSDTRR